MSIILKWENFNRYPYTSELLESKYFSIFLIFSSPKSHLCQNKQTNKKTHTHTTKLIRLYFILWWPCFEVLLVALSLNITTDLHTVIFTWYFIMYQKPNLLTSHSSENSYTILKFFWLHQSMFIHINSAAERIISMYSCDMLLCCLFIFSFSLSKYIVKLTISFLQLSQELS